MIRETRELLAVMAAVNRQIPDAALGFIDDSITATRESELGGMLIELGELLQSHAQDRACQIIDMGEPS